ncbi:MAG: transcriptional repressor [Pseudomonadota bacterium]
MIEKVVASGEKCTAQRRLVCEAIERSSDHPTAQQIYERVGRFDLKLSAGSVYRTLRLLEDLGLVVKHDFRGAASRFELATDESHDHLIDTRSGKVIEFHDPEIDAIKRRIAIRYGFDLEGHTFELYGHPTDQPDRRSNSSPSRLTRLDRARLRLR